MKTPTVSSNEKRWRAEEDARTLVSHCEIVNNKTRYNAAIKVASKQVTELNKQVTATKAVIKKGGK